MKALCTVPGCDRTATGYGRLCNAHKSRKRRHGHPQQETITSANVKPYRRTIRDWIDAKENAESIWKQLEERWVTVVTWAEDTERLPKTGRAFHRPTVTAAIEVLKVARNVEPQVVIETVAAMVYMLEDDPRQFRNDDSFRRQLVRRTRGLTDVNAGSWYDHGSCKVKRVYRELSPKVAKAMAQVLIDGLGVVGLMISRKIEVQAKQEKEKKMALYETLEVTA